jgi:hypothetical protein
MKKGTLIFGYVLFFAVLWGMVQGVVAITNVESAIPLGDPPSLDQMPQEDYVCSEGQVGPDRVRIGDAIIKVRPKEKIIWIKIWDKPEQYPIIEFNIVPNYRSNGWVLSKIVFGHSSWGENTFESKTYDETRKVFAKGWTMYGDCAPVKEAQK